MIPGFSQELMPKGREKESQARIKRFMTMMDSMTNEGNAIGNWGSTFMSCVCFNPFFYIRVELFPPTKEEFLPLIFFHYNYVSPLYCTSTAFCKELWNLSRKYENVISMGAFHIQL